ncbi:MAG: aminoglycoside phosphotransferase family protein [Pseudomonadota bacterium]
MVFKQNWEKTNDRTQVPAGLVETMLQLAYPGQTLKSHQVIAGGCANLNIKVIASGTDKPFNLRIYLRDKDAAFRESALGNLLNSEIAAPLTYYIGDCEGYRFALTEYLEGITLRDLLLSDRPYDIAQIGYEVGTVLAKISEHQFPLSGFLDAQLNVSQPLSQASYLQHAEECLQHPVVQTQLGSNMVMNIRVTLEQNANFFPWEQDAHLVHGDFGPENILVCQQDGNWKISGVLDWEFAYAGSTIADISNMLRYAQHMPEAYETSFLQALYDHEVLLPSHWRITMHMMNILSLLGCLARTDPKKQPNQCADICALIDVHLKPLQHAIPLGRV